MTEIILWTLGVAAALIVLLVPIRAPIPETSPPEPDDCDRDYYSISPPEPE